MGERFMADSGGCLDVLELGCRSLGADYWNVEPDAFGHACDM
jgi:hypothetical protein